MFRKKVEVALRSLKENCRGTDVNSQLSYPLQFIICQITGKDAWLMSFRPPGSDPARWTVAGQIAATLAAARPWRDESMPANCPPSEMWRLRPVQTVPPLPPSLFIVKNTEFPGIQWDHSLVLWLHSSLLGAAVVGRDAWCEARGVVVSADKIAWLRVTENTEASQLICSRRGAYAPSYSYYVSTQSCECGRQGRGPRHRSRGLAQWPAKLRKDDWVKIPGNNFGPVAQSLINWMMRSRRVALIKTSAVSQLKIGSISAVGPKLFWTEIARKFAGTEKLINIFNGAFSARALQHFLKITIRLTSNYSDREAGI